MSESLKLISIVGNYRVFDSTDQLFDYPNSSFDVLSVRYNDYSYQVVLDEQGVVSSDSGRGFSTTFEVDDYRDVDILLRLVIQLENGSKIVLKSTGLIQPKNIFDGIYDLGIVTFKYDELSLIEGCIDPMSTDGSYEDCATLDDGTQCTYDISNQCMDSNACTSCDDVGCFTECSYCETNEEYKCFTLGDVNTGFKFYNPSEYASGVEDGSNCIYPEQPVQIGFMKPDSDRVFDNPYDNDLSYYFDKDNGVWDEKPPIIVRIFIDQDNPITSFSFTIDKVVLSTSDLPKIITSRGAEVELSNLQVINNNNGSSTLVVSTASEIIGEIFIIFSKETLPLLNLPINIPTPTKPPEAIARPNLGGLGSYDDIIQLRNCLIDINFFNDETLIQPIFYDKSCIEVNKYVSQEFADNDYSLPITVQTEGNDQYGSPNKTRLTQLKEMGGKKYQQVINLHRGENIVSFWNLEKWYFGTKLNTFPITFPYEKYPWIDRFEDNCGGYEHEYNPIIESDNWWTYYETGNCDYTPPGAWFSSGFEPDVVDGKTTFSQLTGEARGITYGKILAGLSYSITICQEHIFDGNNNPKYAYNGICFEETQVTNSKSVCESGYLVGKPPIQLGLPTVEGFDPTVEGYWCPGDLIKEFEIIIDENTFSDNIDEYYTDENGDPINGVDMDSIAISLQDDIIERFKPYSGVIPNNFLSYTTKDVTSYSGCGGGIDAFSIPCSELSEIDCGFSGGDCEPLYDDLGYLQINDPYFQLEEGNIGILMNNVSDGAFQISVGENSNLRTGILPQCKEDLYQPISTILAYKNIPPSTYRGQNFTGIESDNYSIIEYETELMTQSDNDNDGILDTWLGTLTQQQIGQGYNNRLIGNSENWLLSLGGDPQITVGNFIGKWLNVAYDDCGVCSGDARFHIVDSDKDDDGKCCLYPYEKQTWYRDVNNSGIGRFWSDKLILCETTPQPYNDGEFDYYPNATNCLVNEIEDCSGACFENELNPYFKVFDKFGNCCYRGNIDICGQCDGNGSICSEEAVDNFYGIEQFCPEELFLPDVTLLQLIQNTNDSNSGIENPYLPNNSGTINLGFQTPVSIKAIEFKIYGVRVYDSSFTNYENFSVSTYENDDNSTSVFVFSPYPFEFLEPTNESYNITLFYNDIFNYNDNPPGVYLNEFDVFYPNGADFTYDIDDMSSIINIIYGCGDINGLNYSPICDLFEGYCDDNPCVYSNLDCDGNPCVDPDCPLETSFNFVNENNINSFTNSCGVCVSMDNNISTRFELLNETINVDIGQDCNSDCFGNAFVNVCSLCVGGETFVEPFFEHPTIPIPTIVEQGQDCNGDCDGNAIIDDCGVCSRGNSGHEANSDKDCHGVCFGINFIDECGVCSCPNIGNPLCGDNDHVPNSDKDCNGDCFGDSQLDDCGVCNGPGLLYWFFDQDGDGVVNCNINDFENVSPYVRQCDSPDNLSSWIQCTIDTNQCIVNSFCSTTEDDTCPCEVNDDFCYDDCNTCIPVEFRNDGYGGRSWPGYNYCAGCGDETAVNYDSNLTEDCTLEINPEASDFSFYLNENDCCIYQDELIDNYFLKEATTDDISDIENLDEYLMYNFGPDGIQGESIEDNLPLIINQYGGVKIDGPVVRITQSSKGNYGFFFLHYPFEDTIHLRDIGNYYFTENPDIYCQGLGLTLGVDCDVSTIQKDFILNDSFVVYNDGDEVFVGNKGATFFGFEGFEWSFTPNWGHSAVVDCGENPINECFTKDFVFAFQPADRGEEADYGYFKFYKIQNED